MLGVAFDGIMYPLYFEFVKKRPQIDAEKISEKVDNDAKSVEKISKTEEKQTKSCIEAEKNNKNTDKDTIINTISDEKVVEKAKSVEKVAKSVEKVAKSVEKVEKSVEKVEKEAKKAEKKVEKEAKKVEKEAKKAEKEAEKEAKKIEKEAKKAEKVAKEEAEKKQKKAKKKAIPPKKRSEDEIAIYVAAKLLRKWKLFVDNTAHGKCNKKLIIPHLHFSCDSGYSAAMLKQCAEDCYLIYISVPTKTHVISQINDGKTDENQTMQLKTWINTVFLPAESQHNEQEKDLPKAKKTPFTLRFRAFYRVLGSEMVFLAFRYNGSTTVSVIYCPEKSIFGKTLRRHWFQRTHIEQFFRLLKHVLRIQDARTRTKHAFEVKLLRFAFVAIHLQLLVRAIRKKCKEFANKSVIVLQRILCDDPEIKHLLQENLF